MLANQEENQQNDKKINFITHFSTAELPFHNELYSQNQENPIESWSLKSHSQSNQEKYSNIAVNQHLRILNSMLLGPLEKDKPHEEQVIHKEDDQQLSGRVERLLQNRVSEDSYFYQWFNVDDNCEDNQKLGQSIFGISFNSQLISKQFEDCQSINIAARKYMSQSVKKNSNMPKFLIRLFIKHFRLSVTDNPKAEDYLTFFTNFCQRFEANPREVYLVDQLISLLRLIKWTSQQNKFLRKKMRTMISHMARKEILNSSQIKLKTSYLNSVKIYGLRCTSSSLSERLQSR